MERFAIINDKLRLNLYNICRLCGIDNPSKIKILDTLKIPNDSDEEPCLSKKIECVVGIKVKRNDQMPQSICTLCVDKINDFFEYREMCGATNIQTRKLLGIPLDIPKRKKIGNDKEIKTEGESILGLGLEDGDITDIKTSVKLTKQRVKGRPKKRGNSSKKKVTFKDDEVKVESEEIKTEAPAVKTSNKNVTKRPKIELKKLVEEAPLLTLKEPNKRERRREIDAKKLERRRIREEQRREIEEKKRQIELAKQILEQKKLEKKRKRKGPDPELPIKKLKQEVEVDLAPLHSCLICSKAFVTTDMLSTHLEQSHTVTISSFGCSSCAESFKSLNEEKDHELWHSLSKTSYICPICNVAFDKTSIFSRHITLCKPFTLTPTVTNINCNKCKKEFLTQNLYQWHKCFVKPNGRCWHCKRAFVKASTLFKHTFKCASADSLPKEPTVKLSIDTKKQRKSRTFERESHIKSEPEANLDMDVPPLHVLPPDMLPVVVLTKTTFKPNQSIQLNIDDVAIKTENDFDDFDENLTLDEPFNDANDSDENDEAEQMNGGALDGTMDVAMEGTMEGTTDGATDGTMGGTMEAAMDETMNDAANELSDDDVILIENNEEPVLVNGSPSGTRNATEKPFVLPIVIKREPVDSYEVIPPVIFDPAKKIKTEPLDESSVVPEKQNSPKRSSVKQRRSKKSTQKPNKERQPLVHIKEEPVDTDDLRNNVFRMAPTHNMGSAVVSLPTNNLLERPIKQEPIRPGYDDDFDPVLAMNIKKEPGLDDLSPSKMPLKLSIFKKHGTLNSKLISPQGENSQIESHAISPKTTKPKRVKDKRLYKKPALLAEKIRQEMIARMAKDKEMERSSRQSLEETNDFTVPVIARVLDATTISDLPLVRVKIEPKSPHHSPYHNSESISDSLPTEQIPAESAINANIESKSDSDGDSAAASIPDMEALSILPPSEEPSEATNLAPSDKPLVLNLETFNVAPSDEPLIPFLEALHLPTSNELSLPNLEALGLLPPSDGPSDGPSDVPSDGPSDVPSDGPSDEPSDEPSDVPSDVPSDGPSEEPSDKLSDGPSDKPSDEPSDKPSDGPSDGPSEGPSVDPKELKLEDANNEQVKSTLDIESLCELRPISQTNDKTTDSNPIQTEQINKTIPTDENVDLMELAGLSFNELMKSEDNSAPNGQAALESNETTGSRESNASVDNQLKSFDPMAFNENNHPTADKNTFNIPSEHKVSYEVINDIVSTVPLPVNENVAKEANDESTAVANDDASNTSEILSSKENADGENSALSDSSESNKDKVNYLNVNTHSSGESQLEISSICNEKPDNEKVKSTEQLLANRDEDVENELLKSPANENADYENSVQTLTTSAIHEQLHSLLEDISEDSLSCDIDLDDKTVDWEWESKLLGD